MPIGRNSEKEAPWNKGSVVNLVSNVSRFHNLSLLGTSRKCAGWMDLVGSGHHGSESPMGSSQQGLVLANDCPDRLRSRNRDYPCAVDFEMDTRSHSVSVLCGGWLGYSWDFATHG